MTVIAPIQTWTLASVVLAALVLLPSCQQKQSNSLPPATGANAPPAPQIPALRELAR